jgi:AcrR family transcriptional regulator
MAKKSAADAALTRDAIIAAARKLFGEKGYANTSTALIARAASVTEGAFFHHFKDKKALFAEVVKELQRQYDAAVINEAIKAATPMERLLAGARTALRLSQAPEYMRVVLIEAPAILGQDEWKKIDSELALASIEPGLRALAGDSNIDRRQLRPVALQTLGLLNEACFALARGDDTVSEDAVIDLLESALHDWVRRLQS